MSEVKSKLREATQYKKGENGYKKGFPEDLREARKMNKTTATMLLNKFLFMDREQLQKIMTNPATPLVELIIGKVVEHAIKYGDHKRLEFLLTRLIGPVQATESTIPPPTIIKLVGQDAAIAIGHYEQNGGERLGD